MKLDLTVNGKDLNMAEVGAGLDASWKHKNVDGSSFDPSLHAGYSYDLVGDRVEVTSAFAAGGGTFVSQGADPARSRIDAGAGLSYQTTDNWQFSANYDYNFKEDFSAHSGYLRAGYRF